MIKQSGMLRVNETRNAERRPTEGRSPARPRVAPDFMWDEERFSDAVQAFALDVQDASGRDVTDFVELIQRASQEADDLLAGRESANVGGGQVSELLETTTGAELYRSSSHTASIEVGVVMISSIASVTR